MISLLLGGIGLFLVGMWMVTDGRKVAAGDTHPNDAWIVR